MIFHYGKFKEPLASINSISSLIDWVIDPNDSWYYEEIWRKAPDYHFYETLYGSPSKTSLFIYCHKNSSISIKSGASLWKAPEEQYHDMDICNSILANGNPYNAWLNTQENWIAIVGLEYVKQYCLRTQYLYAKYN